MTGIIFPFGSNKGKLVETVFDDIHYMHWLLSQQWIEEKHPEIYRAVFRRVLTLMNSEFRRSIDGRHP